MLNFFYLHRHRFFPAHLRRAQPRTIVRIPTEPFSPRAGSRPEQYRVGAVAVAVVGRGGLVGSEVYTQKERFPESVTNANGDRLGGFPDVVHKRGKDGCPNLLQSRMLAGR